MKNVAIIFAIFEYFAISIAILWYFAILIAILCDGTIPKYCNTLQYYWNHPWGPNVSPQLYSTGLIFIHVNLYLIASEWTTKCMKGLFRPNNTGRTYNQIRLRKTLKRYTIAGGYNNLPVAMFKSSDHSRVLSVVCRCNPHG